MGRVQQRSQEVENRALPALRAQFARRPDVLERRVIVRRKEEREAMLTQGSSSLLGRLVDGDAQGVEHVRTTGATAIGLVVIRTWGLG